MSSTKPKMSLARWDREVAPYLRSMRQHAVYLRQHMIGMVSDINALVVRPDFETKAIAEIDEALEQCKRTVTLIDQRLNLVREAYQKKEIG